MSLINLKFSPEMEELILQGKKCCTTRDEKKGEAGDLFVVGTRVYRIIQINECDLNYASVMANAEGFNNDIEFEDCIMDIYPDLSLDSTVYIHYFAYVDTIDGDCEYCPCIEYIDDPILRFKCCIQTVTITEDDITGCPGDTV